MTHKTMGEQLVEFNQLLPSVKEEYFQRDCGGDHGFIHIGGLTTENIENNGMFLGKSAELTTFLLEALHQQVAEVAGDLISFSDAYDLDESLKKIRTEFSRVAYTIQKSNY